MPRTIALAALVIALSLPVSAGAAETAADKTAPKQANPARGDLYGDPLPPGALVRFGTTRFRLSEVPTSAALSEDTKFVAAVGANAVILLDGYTGRTVRQFRLRDSQVQSAAFSGDGTLLATLSSNGSISVFEMASGKIVRTLAGAPDLRGSMVCFSPDGRKIARAASRLDEHFNSRGEVSVWEVASGKQIAQGDTLQNEKIEAAFSPDGNTLASWGSYLKQGAGSVIGLGDWSPEGNKVQLWEIRSGKERHRISLQGDGIACVTFAPDGKSIAVARHSGPVVLLAAPDGKEIRRIGHRQPNTPEFVFVRRRVSFSPDGKRLAVAGPGVKTWKVDTGEPLSEQKGFPTGQPELVFNREGVWSCSTVMNAVRIWNGITGEARGAQENPVSVLAIALSGGARRLWSTDVASRLCSWDVESGRQLTSTVLVDYGQVLAEPTMHSAGTAGTGAVFSRHAKYLLFPDNLTGAIRLRDVEAGRDVHRFPLMLWGRLAAGFSCDSRRLAVAGMDLEATARPAAAPAGRQDPNDPSATIAQLMQQGQVLEWYSTDRERCCNNSKE